MVNADSRLDNLQKGRGKKKRLGHKSYSIKLSPEAKKNVENIAQSFSCVHGNSGSISSLLNKLASKELIVVAAPPAWDNANSSPVVESTESTKPGNREVLPSPAKVRKKNLPKLISSVDGIHPPAEGGTSDADSIGEDQGSRSSPDRQSTPIA